MMMKLANNIKVKKLTDTAKLPTQGSEYAAGWDLYSDGEYEIAPGGTVKIKTGLAFELPEGSFAGIFARSGLATKNGLRPANCVGVIDSDYRGPVIVALHNDSNEMQVIPHGMRVAQFILLPYLPIKGFEVVEELNDTERGAGGFGSTGTN